MQASKPVHHMQKFKVRFEDNVYNNNSNTFTTLEPARYSIVDANEYEEFTNGQHSTQVHREEREAGVKFRKHYW